MEVWYQLYLLLDVKLGENDVENNDFLLRKSGIVARKTMKYAWICIITSLKKEENRDVKGIEKGVVLWFNRL